MNKDIQDCLTREILRALDGKLGGTYALMLATRISQLAWLDEKFPEFAKSEREWLGPALLRLVETGDTKTLRQVADARDQLRKDGEVRNGKRYIRLSAYLAVYQRESRAPKIREILDELKISSADQKRAMHEERAIRKLLDETNLPYTNVPTGHPKGTKNLKNSERLPKLRSLILRE